MEIPQGAVLLYFSSPTCIPCRAMWPTVEQLSAQYPKVKVVKLMVSDIPELVAEHTIKSVPTMLLLLDGKVIGRITGAAPRTRIEEFFQSVG